MIFKFKSLIKKTVNKMHFSTKRKPKVSKSNKSKSHLIKNSIQMPKIETHNT